MFKPNSQLKDISKVFFNIKYSDIGIFEEFFSEKANATSVYEIESKTIEPCPDDIWCFEAYYYVIQPNFSLIRDEIKNLAEYNNIQITSDITWEEIENKDWVALYQNQLSPIKTNNFFICTKLYKDEYPKDKIPILIEASRAFGTGSHGTTFGCIEALEYLANMKIEINKILDIGTGTGILSFVAEKLWNNAEIFACDIEKEAIEIAEENASFNNSRVNFYQNSVDKILLGKHSFNKFDLIISNILALPLINLSTQITNIINKNGYLILSGFLDYQMEEVKNAYQKLGFQVMKIIYKDSWVVLVLQFVSSNHWI